MNINGGIKMGYYTSHEMEIRTGTHNPDDIINEMMKERNGTFCGLDISANYDCYDEDGDTVIFLQTRDAVKWYSEEHDMIEFSKKFPDAVFTVNGFGEERDDVWQHQYKNGNERYRKMTLYWDDWDREEF